MLILEDCTWLSEIGPLISQLKKLRSLNLRKCSLVKKLPLQPCWMQSLRELLIDETGIKEIIIDSDSLKELQKLSACGCTELGYISPIGHLTKLESLALDGTKINLDPETFEFPRNLWRLSLRNCSMVLELPPSVRELRNLKTLKMGGTPLREFPEDIVNLKKLEEIDFSGCTNLEAQDSCDISGLSSLRILRLSSSIVAGLPQNICGLSRLQTLDILECDQLRVLPELPSSLQSLRWGSRKTTVPDLSHLTDLKELLLKDVQHPVGGLLNLKTPRNFSTLTLLQELTLSYMELDLTQLPLTPSLSTVSLEHCKIPEPKFSILKYLSELKLGNCNLAEIDGLEDLERLEVLEIIDCRSITDLNGLKDLPRLRKVGGVFSAQPSLPEFTRHVDKDICGRKKPEANSSGPAIGRGITNLASKQLLKDASSKSTAAQLFNKDEKEKKKQK
ncbi:hypothetical protein BT93_L5881 [Corymbia citriodora subsp. variegata]|uniref:Uncharacterized protein n=1 Tax=Corymbia citriodora subsp. variegata TaxID=360336 RepID=A0A8T0CR85_CORYI|nr:hypothetical protein BT93_L5881 [Corymbia citriodora subsp. variegata]